jgi:hypothetical protein
MSVIIPYFKKSLFKLIYEEKNFDKIAELRDKMQRFKEHGGSFDNWIEPWKLRSEFYDGSQLKQEYIREIKRYYPNVGKQYISHGIQTTGVEPKTDDDNYVLFKRYVLTHHEILEDHAQHRYSDLDDLISEISGYSSWGTEFRSYDTVEKLVDGFINNQEMAMPLRCSGVQISGNTRLDIAYIMGIPVKVVSVR